VSLVREASGWRHSRAFSGEGGTPLAMPPWGSGLVSSCSNMTPSECKRRMPLPAFTTFRKSSRKSPTSPQSQARESTTRV
jgi:hypothetical protein